MQLMLPFCLVQRSFPVVDACFMSVRIICHIDCDPHTASYHKPGHQERPAIANTAARFHGRLAISMQQRWHVLPLCRVLSGLLNSNSGISKTYLGETCTKEQQPAAFATFCVMYGLGSVIAPAIGGFLRFAQAPPNALVAYNVI